MITEYKTTTKHKNNNINNPNTTPTTNPKQTWVMRLAYKSDNTFPKLPRLLTLMFCKRDFRRICCTWS